MQNTAAPPRQPQAPSRNDRAADEPEALDPAAAFALGQRAALKSLTRPGRRPRPQRR